MKEVLDMMLKQWNELRNYYRTFGKNNLEKRIEFEKKNKEFKTKNENFRKNVEEQLKKYT
nr:MAG TPA: hypothetical protein [Caudoviricetes sp.]